MAESPNSDPHVQMITELVLETARHAQAQQNAIRDNSIMLAELRRVHEGSFESILAVEVDRLADRIAILHQRPLFQRLGKHALGITYYPGHRTQWGGYERPRISTEPVLDGEAAVVEDKLLVYSGLIAWRYAKEKRDSHENRTVHLSRQIKDETTGAARNQDLYNLLPYDSKIGRRVQVKGGEFDEYEKDRCAEVMAEYAEKNPWVKKLGEHFVYDNQQLDGQITKHVPYYKFDLNNISRVATPDMPNTHWGEDLLHKLHKELVPLLSPGEAWDFPDEMFLEPLALVQQMNLYLGTKNK